MNGVTESQNGTHTARLLSFDLACPKAVYKSSAYLTPEDEYLGLDGSFSQLLYQSYRVIYRIAVDNILIDKRIIKTTR